MNVKHTIEALRMSEQERLDALKSAAERNRWGQFATPPALARSLARYALSIFDRHQRICFLDPAIGTGSFFSALLDVAASPGRVEAATGVELDPLFADAAESLWGSAGLKVLRDDFTRRKPTGDVRFNLVLTNPPYIRHHHLDTADKERLRNRLAHSMQMGISGLAGLYCYFLLLCHDWMEDEGLGLWLIPSEFMDVNYGSAVRTYLTERVTLLRLHRYSPSDVQFADALVSSSVVVFRKAPPPIGHQAVFSFRGPIDSPGESEKVSMDDLRRARKWTRFPGRTHTEPTEIRLGDLFTVKRGLASGANDFFILTEARVAELRIPKQFLKPILPSPRHLTDDVVEAFQDGSPATSPRLYLLDCEEPDDSAQGPLARRWPRLHAYLQEGRARGIANAYLASRRSPWYSQERRPPAPFLCTYMGRGRNGAQPFRFIWNRSQATAHNVYLLLYPKQPLQQSLSEDPRRAALVFEALREIEPARLLAEGRVYGGGLHKLEPKELSQAPADTVVKRLGISLQRPRTMFE